MPTEMHFRRKNIRLGASNYLGDRWYFITCCTEGRRPVFQEAKLARWVLAQLRASAAVSSFSVYAYCVMPDHLHFLVRGLAAESRLLDFVELFKQRTAHAYENRRKQKLWQKKFYDHILRRATSVDAVAGYIWMNPVRKGLCERFQAYPFSGSFMMPWPPKSFEDEPWRPPWKKRE
jgi:putative transposase